MSYYDRDTCYSCGPCKRCFYSTCDRCSASCCIDNMNSHRELYRLNDDFSLYLQNALNDLCRKCDEIRNSLINSYGININYNSSFYSIYDCENFLNILREKRTELNNLKYNEENQIVDLIKKCEENMKQLKLEKEKKLIQIMEQFDKKTKTSEDLFLNEKKNLKIKMEKKEKLIQNLKDIGANKELILKNYEAKEILKADAEYNKNINELDEQYKFQEEKLEYTDNEKKLKEKYSDEIQKIKSYSDNPYFKNIINSFGINKYLK